MKKNSYIYLCAVLLFSLPCNNITAMDTTPPLEVPQGVTEKDFDDIPTEEYPIADNARKNEEKRNQMREILKGTFQLSAENPIVHSNQSGTLYAQWLDRRHHSQKLEKSEEGSRGASVNTNNSAPDPDVPKKPNRPGKEKPFSLEELQELGVKIETLHEEELLDALRIDLSSNPPSLLSSTEQKGREDATVRSYGIVAELLQQKKLSHEINKLKVKNEIEQMNLLLNENFPLLSAQVQVQKEAAQTTLALACKLSENYGKVHARSKFAEERERINLILQNPLQHLRSLAIQTIDSAITRVGSDIIATHVVAAAIKLENWLYTACTSKGKKLHADNKAGEIVQELNILIADQKTSIGVEQTFNIRNPQADYYKKQMHDIAAKKYDDWVKIRLARWNLQYTAEEQNSITNNRKVEAQAAEFEIAPMIEEEEEPNVKSL